VYIYEAKGVTSCAGFTSPDEDSSGIAIGLRSTFESQEKENRQGWEGSQEEDAFKTRLICLKL
jgi:hypothetical protein